MPPFPKPRFDYEINLKTELTALRDYERGEPGRAIPDKHAGNLLLATWNIANLGVQKRSPEAYRLIAEILSWFDVIAIQEVNDNPSGLLALRSELPRSYGFVYSDASGNKERLTYVYDTLKVTLSDEIGEVAFPPSEYRWVNQADITGYVFNGFDRTPYLATFSAGNFVFSVVNCHSFFGDGSQASMDRRTLETLAVARYTDLRRKSRHAVTTDIVALGDFNLPKLSSDDPIYRALTKRGLEIPQHSTQIGSAIASDNHYDQIAFFPGETQQNFVRSGVFDFDGCLFVDLWNDRGEKDFMAWSRYYISDHRPLWAEFRGG